MGQIDHSHLMDSMPASLRHLQLSFILSSGLIFSFFSQSTKADWVRSSGDSRAHLKSTVDYDRYYLLWRERGIRWDSPSPHSARLLQFLSLSLLLSSYLSRSMHDSAPFSTTVYSIVRRERRRRRKERWHWKDNLALPFSLLLQLTVSWRVFEWAASEWE